MPKGLLDFARRIRFMKKELRYWAYKLWLKAVYPELSQRYEMKQFEKAGLCPCCGAHTKNWQEVFGEVHKCYTE